MTIAAANSGGLGPSHHRSLMYDLKDTWAKSGGFAADFLLYLAAEHEVPGPIAGDPTITDSSRNCVTLSWPKPLHSGDAPVLAYRVEAWRLGSEGGARWTELGISPTNAYDAFGLTAGAEYRLRITARNRHGWGEPHISAAIPVQLTAPTLPEFARPLAGHIKALKGQDLTIECQVRGEPSPQTRWTLDSEPVADSGDGRVVLSRDGGLCRLALRAVREEDAGRYCCEAINAAGRVSTFVRLQVVTDPHLLHADVKLRRDFKGAEIT